MAVVRYVLFCLFFAVGAGSISLSILIDEINDYYVNTHLLKKTEQMNQTIEQMNEDITVQISQIENDPNILKNLQRVVFGKEPQKADTAYPKITDPRWEYTVDAVLKDDFEAAETNVAPDWVGRISKPKMRYSLFLAGAGLILVDFIFFAAATKQRKGRYHDHLS